MPNPTSSPSVTVNGVWFIPYSAPGVPVSAKAAWVGTKSPALQAAVSMDIFTIANRAEEPSQDGVLHRYRGDISGLLISGQQDGLTADQWFSRLQNLVANQREYWAIYLVSTRWAPFKIKFHSLSTDPVQAGGYAHRVDVSFREVD